MKKSEFINKCLTAYGGLEKVSLGAVIAAAEAAGAKWDPAVDLRPCPNPRCTLVTPELEKAGTDHWVECESCDLTGPVAADRDEACALWNKLRWEGDEEEEGREPEEPELPERLVLGKDLLGGVTIDEGPESEIPWIDLSLITGAEPLTFEEIQRLKELLARYNAISNILGDTTPPRVREYILGTLKMEREKLK